jgi:hypothetical protein
MKITSISTYLEINRTLKMKKGIQAQSGLAWPSGASRTTQGRGPARPAGRTANPSPTAGHACCKRDPDFLMKLKLSPTTI